jgi:hypothetical protein
MPEAGTISPGLNSFLKAMAQPLFMIIPNNLFQISDLIGPIELSCLGSKLSF